MKKVFLIGDSIRLGYAPHVRELLKGQAEVYWSQDNARFAAYTLRYAHEWAAECGCAEEIDLVHWNNGLWDTLHALSDPLPQTLPAQYPVDLGRVIGRLRQVFPRAEITFATTTPILAERINPQFYRDNAEIERYNQAACEVMRENHIAVDDLYPVARALREDWHALDGLHYTDEGYRALGEAVAEFLRARL